MDFGYHGFVYPDCNYYGNYVVRFSTFSFILHFRLGAGGGGI